MKLQPQTNQRLRRLLIAGGALIGDGNLNCLLNRFLHIPCDWNFDFPRDGAGNRNGFVRRDLSRYRRHLRDLSSSNLLARNLHSNGNVDCLGHWLIVDNLPGLILSLVPRHRNLISVLLIENPLLIDHLLNNLLSRLSHRLY